MCGIIGIIGRQDVATRVVEGLKRLEYRGYDSAGIATLVNGHIDRRRAEGKLFNLSNRLDEAPLRGDIGIGHTRWATHGVPNEINAHPHATERVALVHNGIIENFKELKEELLDHGSNFASETDTEVVAHLLTQYLNEGMDPVAAAEATLKRLEGAFALAVIFSGEHDLMIGARRGSPLVVGYGDGEMFLGSDAIALAPWTNRISYLDEGDWVVVHRDSAEVRDAAGRKVEREIKLTAASLGDISKGNYRHYMLKEIYEQPTVIGDTIHSYFNPDERSIQLPDLTFDFSEVPKVTVIACGTSFYAAMIAKYWFESVARLPVDIDIASEFRYRDTPLPEGGVAIFISQSGETMDTLEALKLCKQQGQRIMAIVNVPDSSIARESEVVLQTLAGPEIGVASTKAFTTQLVTLACIVITAAKQCGTLEARDEAILSQAITEVPSRAVEVLHHDDRLRELAQEMFKARDALYLGRGTGFPIALEGALKLKEISYIHAEGYPAGEMKHGPIALIDEQVPVIVVAPKDKWFEKVASNIQEVSARGGKVVLLSDAEGVGHVGDMAWAAIQLPTVHAFVAPILYAIPVQLLAYHIAVLKGTDVDQPRNLAKSVTVE
ncbi:MAG: glutamine--fructose-6-phosphate transaminase (isomerizing) [Alphaproteobacteria bacterium]|jgi:glucosamine--fructose-6-phosphate aminotransferase (isomerizing)|nr:glutamine--fructose-6-phosphate transaminase (isomerizing) [Alphaproteobacteria bacterium]MDP6812851.1 glutamine--fructose-6-phosphate transaminase (isomerizing) [Alphaproteobacteria bacterium]